MANPTSCSSGGLANDPSCVPVMANYCSTDDPTITYTEKWEGDEITSLCRRYVVLNTGQQAQYVPVVDAYVRRYLVNDGNNITYAQQGSVVYDPAIEDIIAVCQDYPGGFTRDDLKENPNLGKLCGCFMTDAEYDKYTGAFGVQKICDPACVLQSAVKPRDPANQFITLSCGQSICVIDDVTISILGKSTTGDITFAQSCASCTGGAGCTCNISDISITSVESTLGNISLDQACGSTPNCFKRDANGIPQQVPCSALEPGGGGTSTGKGFISNNLLLIIIVAIVVFIILIIIFVLLFRRRQETPSYRPQAQMVGPPPYSGNYYGPAGFTGSGPLSQAPLV
jgi:hypothetical protein